MFFAVAPVTSGIDADGREFAAFAPAFDGEDGDTEDVSDFADGQEVRKTGQTLIRHGRGVHLIHKITDESGEVKRGFSD